MTRHVMIIVVSMVACPLVGCSVSAPGTTRMLETADYELSFVSGLEVMAQYFTIDTSDPATGVIKSMPRPIEAPAERLLGGSPARLMGTLRIRRSEGQVVAHVTVVEQRQGSAMQRQMRTVSENYDSVPNLTPADEEAATTTEQNEAWQTYRYDANLERKILRDLYQALHSEPGR